MEFFSTEVLDQHRIIHLLILLDDFDQELALHLAVLLEEYRGQGMSQQSRAVRNIIHEINSLQPIDASEPPALASGSFEFFTGH